MTIHIENLEYHVIIGLLDFEREKSQRVIIQLEASYDYQKNKFIDYADITTLIKEKLKKEKYELLEDALIGLKNSLCTTYPQLQTLKLKIAKPDILNDCSVALSETWQF